jgi:uncharacterized protein with GYD domain
MAIYLWSAKYTESGAKGLMKVGGVSRRDAVAEMVSKAGGKLHAFYYALGEYDVYGIAEFPDAVTATAMSMAVNASGAVTLHTTVLLTPEEMTAATKKSITYRPPGA